MEAEALFVETVEDLRKRCDLRHYRDFIDAEVAAGRYRSASDVVRSALRLLEERETQLRALRGALVAGERSGASAPFDFDAFLARKRADHTGRR